MSHNHIMLHSSLEEINDEVLKYNISIMNLAESLSFVQSTFLGIEGRLAEIATVAREVPELLRRVISLEDKLDFTGVSCRSLIADAWAYYRTLTPGWGAIVTQVRNGTVTDTDLFEKTKLHLRDYVLITQMLRNRNQSSHTIVQMSWNRNQASYSFPLGHHHHHFLMMTESDVRSVCDHSRINGENVDAVLNLIAVLQTKIATADPNSRPGDWTMPCPGTLTRCPTCASYCCQAEVTLSTCNLQPVCFCTVDSSDCDTN